MPSSSPPTVRTPGGPVPAASASGGWRQGLGAIGGETWLRAAALALAAALVIAVPTRLVPNGFFSRMTPTRPLDYVFLVASSALLGLTFALRGAGAGAPGTRTAAAGIGTVFAVGCPVCNKLVVAFLGSGGAMSIFAPLQPLIGLGAAGLLAAGLRHQLRALGAATCTPAGTGSAGAGAGTGVSQG